MPARGTSAGQFCGSVGAIGSPEHCYQLQEPNGNLSDSVGGLTLTASGSARYGIVTGLPIESSGAADFATEKAVSFDGSAYFSNTDTPPEIASFTFVFRQPANAATSTVFDWGYISGAGYIVAIATTGYISAAANFGTAVARNDTAIAVNDNAWHCATIAFNGASTVGWIDGTAIAWNSAWVDYGSTTGAGNVRLGRNVLYYTGSLARWRIDHSAVATVTDHQAICGTFAKPLVASHAAYSDSTWSRSGGAQCYRTGTATATCFPGGGMGYRWNGSAYRWATDADSRTNRILYSAAPVCATGWTCTTATIAAAVAPDGSKTAGAITMGGGSVAVAGTGYTASAPVYPRMWVKLAAGDTLDASNVGGSGHWTIDGTAIAGTWTEIYTGHAAVTEVQAWTATGAGAVNITFSEADASVWMPTVTQVRGYSVIPTGAAAVTTGDAAWTIANAGDLYWKTGDTVTADWSLLSGTCFVTGNPLRLTGAAGSECVGDFSSLEIQR